MASKKKPIYPHLTAANLPPRAEGVTLDMYKTYVETTPEDQQSVSSLAAYLKTQGVTDLGVQEATGLNAKGVFKPVVPGTQGKTPILKPDGKAYAGDAHLYPDKLDV